MSPVRFVPFLIAVICVCASIRGQTPVVVYENSSDYSGRFNVSLREYGDEIVLTGTARLVTQFQFEYYGRFVSQGDESARVRFYSNTGPAWRNTKDWITPAPTPLFETLIPLGTGFNTATITVPYVQVPDHFTWTIQFFGVTMTVNDTAGLLFYGKPTLGKSFNDYWEFLSVGWTPEYIDGVTNNFAAKVMAVDAAPPPPALNVTANGGNLVLSWPATMTGLYLESRPALDAGIVWSPVYPQPLRVGDVYQTSIAMSEGARIFRLNSKPQAPLTILADTSAVHVRWSAAIGSQKLQSKTAIGDAWVDVPTPSRPIGDYYEATLSPTNTSAFFRLMRTF